jgi:N-acetylglucosaminyldiphosphoundecaprenol N-acetyl-beta-D-mannosaminyltransferase
MEGTRRYVLGFPLDALDLSAAADWVLQQVAEARKAPPAHQLVVTLNPEIVVQAVNDAVLAEAVRAANLSVADGVGITWAARRAGTPVPGRVPGVDLAFEVMRRGGAGLRVFLLGAKPGVAERAATEAQRRFGVQVVGSHHGYFAKAQPNELLQQVAASRADLLLAGLGEGQEAFLHQHAAALNAAVMIGVGGTLDVLAGEVKRMPAWTTRLGLEWFFRVTLDRRRWRRIPRLFRFVALVLRGLPA